MRKIAFLLLIALSLHIPAFGEEYQVLRNPKWRNWQADLPWSRLVLVTDNNSAEEIAIFDYFVKGNNVFFTGPRLGLISKWTPRLIDLYTFTLNDPCQSLRGFSTCINVKDQVQPDELILKINNEAIRLEAQEGVIPVTPELAQKLASAPEGNVGFKVTSGSQSWDGEIGASTVRAWKEIYKGQPVSRP